MQLTFKFIIDSFTNLLPDDFYLFPLILLSFAIFVRIIVEMKGLGDSK